MKKKLLGLFSVLIWFLLLILTSVFIFSHMEKRISSLNKETVRDVGFTYLSAMTSETVNHSRTYFEGKFEVLNQILNTALDSEKPPEQVKEQIVADVSGDADYVALLTVDGEREVLRGDATLRSFDMELFEKALELEQNNVSLAINEKKQRMIELMLLRDYSIGGTQYSALICDVPADILNTVLNLFCDEEMVYSFVVRKSDSAFVIRNEDAFSKNYYAQIRERYETYDGKTPEDYIRQIGDAMQNNETYHSVFYIDGEERLLYARKLFYSDWYLLTFMRCSEIEKLLEANNQARSDVFSSCLTILFFVFIIVFCIFAVYSFIHLKQLEKLKNEAVSASRSKSEFLSNMSHDIRTPMNIIVGMTDIARSNIDDKEKMEECLNKITKSSRHLLSLINDVLDMSKIESGKMTLSIVQISLRQSLENIVSIIQPQIKSKNQKFDIYIKNILSEEVYCDSLRLNQILINLLSNAVKYTQEEGTVSMTLVQEESPLGSSYVKNHIYVKDNGVGMTEDFLKIIFDNFVREDKERISKEEGTGLGLAITKHIVDVMNGKITVKSKPNQGSEFHVELDLQRGDVDAEELTLNRMKVLVVDDDPDLCETAVRSLNELSASTEYAISGREAVEIIKKSPHHFDIILIDCQMPDMDGMETAVKIREYTGDDVAVVLISAYDWIDFEQEAKNAGVNGFISKPLFKSTLYLGIKQIMDKTIEEKKEEKQLSPDFSGERILLAEDNELNSEIASVILNNAGFSVEWAENGKCCVDKFQASPEGYYSAILMDIRMPIMNGYEATKAIREMSRSDADIPIIAMTADAFSEDVAKAASYGMNGHIAKPLDTNALFYLLKRELNHSTSNME